jgi:ATP-dependent RNA helicase RhlE
MLPPQRLGVLFSATLAPAVRAIAKSLVHNPVEISIAPEKPAVERITQHLYFMERGDRSAALATLLEDVSVKRAIVFVQMKHAADKLVKFLSLHGVSADAIHSNKSQSAREHALRKFRDGHVRVLVATDIASRGIDVDGVTHVVNYELPREAETYVHRIGRTARAGAEGMAVSFCGDDERHLLKAIERFTGVPLERVDHAHHSDRVANMSAKSGKPFKKKPFYHRRS